MISSHQVQNVGTSIPDEQKLSESQQRLNQWIKAHGEDYAAHAIWSDQGIKGIITDGRVEPSEALLKRKLVLEDYEASACYGGRGCADIRKIISVFKEQKITVDPSIVFSNKISVSEAKKLQFISDSQYHKIVYDAGRKASSREETLKLLEENFKFMEEEKRDTTKLPENFSVKLKDNQEYQVTHDKEGRDTPVDNTFFELNGIPNVYFVVNGYHKKIDALASQYCCDRNHVQIALDLIEGNLTDKRFADIWKTYNKLQLQEGNLYELGGRLLDYRRSKLGNSKIQEVIFVKYCGIAWGYGEVVVLLGNPGKWLSALNHPLDRIKTENDSKLVQYKKGTHLVLLHPFENDGEYCGINLADKDVIVIGPQASLIQYQALSKQKGFQLFFTEEMTREQQEFFQVPLKLRSQIKTSTEVLVPPTNSAPAKLAHAMGTPPAVMQSPAMPQSKVGISTIQKAQTVSIVRGPTYFSGRIANAALNEDLLADNKIREASVKPDTFTINGKKC